MHKCRLTFRSPVAQQRQQHPAAHGMKQDHGKSQCRIYPRGLQILPGKLPGNTGKYQKRGQNIDGKTTETFERFRTDHFALNGETAESEKRESFDYRQNDF